MGQDTNTNAVGAFYRADKHEVRITRRFYEVAYHDGDSKHTEKLGDVRVLKTFVAVPVERDALLELRGVADGLADYTGPGTIAPATAAYAARLRDALDALLATLIAETEPPTGKRTETEVHDYGLLARYAARDGRQLIVLEPDETTTTTEAPVDSNDTTSATPSPTEPPTVDSTAREVEDAARRYAEVRRADDSARRAPGDRGAELRAEVRRRPRQGDSVFGLLWHILLGRG